MKDSVSAPDSTPIAPAMDLANPAGVDPISAPGVHALGRTVAARARPARPRQAVMAGAGNEVELTTCRTCRVASDRHMTDCQTPRNPRLVAARHVLFNLFNYIGLYRSVEALTTASPAAPPLQPLRLDPCIAWGPARLQTFRARRGSRWHSFTVS